MRIDPVKSVHFASMAECLLICNLVNKIAGCKAATISIDSNGHYSVDASVRRETMRELIRYAKEVIEAERVAQVVH